MRQRVWPPADCYMTIIVITVMSIYTNEEADSLQAS